MGFRVIMLVVKEQSDRESDSTGTPLLVSLHVSQTCFDPPLIFTTNIITFFIFKLFFFTTLIWFRLKKTKKTIFLWRFRKPYIYISRIPKTTLQIEMSNTISCYYSSWQQKRKKTSQMDIKPGLTQLFSQN